MDLKLEVVQISVSDVDRAKVFYTERAGFNLDHDAWAPGSACSIHLGTGLSEMEPGCVKGLQLVVTDIDAARAELADRDVEVSEIRELGRPGRPGFRFVYFSDPDGNGRALQQLPYEPHTLNMRARCHSTTFRTV